MGAPIENNSTVKANYYLDRYKAAIEPYKNQCVGSYVFLWGQKQERTPTWYGVFMENGNETESVDVMHFIWKHEWPNNRTPKLLDFKLDDKTAYDNVRLKAENTYDVMLQVEDPDGDQIEYIWDVKPDSTDLGDGGDFESTPESIEGLILEDGEGIKFKAPNDPGAFRLFIYANDGNGRTAHANIPFYVN